MYHLEGIACPNPCNRAANCTILWKGWVISRGTKIFGCPRHLWGRDFAFWLLSLIPFLKFRSTSLPLRISNPPLSLYFLEKQQQDQLYTQPSIAWGNTYINTYIFLRKYVHQFPQVSLREVPIDGFLISTPTRQIRKTVFENF